MKKTTKFLLVLAAVVAMTIGAMSTVMAADPTIATWEDNGDKGWAAYDVDGNKIMRGWAVADSGIYYYFHNGVMQTNRFVTTNNKTYYVNAEGAMHTGWFEFNKDIKVNVNGAAYDNVAKAFGTKVGTGAALAEDTQYETVWCYFDETTGAMVKNAWAQVDGIWYYIDGNFCVMNEKVLNVIKENGKTDKANYGFDASGAMLAGWIAYVDKAADTTTGKDTPYEKTEVGASTTSWAYYGTNGQLAGTGWLKDSLGDWYYMEANGKFGVPTAMANTYLTVDNRTFYFNDSCYMETGVVTLPSEKSVTVKSVVGSAITTNDAIVVPKDSTLTLTFKADGSLVTGIDGVVYYENKVGKKYTIAVNVSGDAIVVSAAEAAAKATGVQWTESFLYVYEKDNATVVNYFSDGAMVKSEAITFGDKILAFDKDGKLISTETEIGGVKYIPADDTLIDGVKFAVVK